MESRSGNDSILMKDNEELMELTFNTPALFPAISLLLPAYTNRVRILHDEYKQGKDPHIVIGQIKNMRQRLNLIRYMQGLDVLSFFCAWPPYIASTTAGRV